MLKTIYESPDRGRTVFAREAMTEKRELLGTDFEKPKNQPAPEPDDSPSP